MKRNLIGLGGLVVLAAICGFGGWWLFRPASASSPPGDDVAMVNGEAITRAQLEFQIATRQRANELNPSIAVPSRGVLLNALIEDTLVRQEAAREGISCSDTEVRSLINEQQSTLATAAAGELGESSADGVLDSIIIEGDLPVSYLHTPVPLRTPSAPDAAATYWASPRIFAGYKSECVMRKVVHMSEDVRPPGVFMKSLRDKADIVLAKGIVLPTPTRIPTPIPPPHLGCGVQFACPNNEGLSP
jgi:hypothetical protein